MEPTRICPFCAEIVKAEAVVCRWCGRALVDEVAASTNAPTAAVAVWAGLGFIIGGTLLAAAILLPWIRFEAVSFTASEVRAITLFSSGEAYTFTVVAGVVSAAAGVVALVGAYRGRALYTLMLFIGGGVALRYVIWAGDLDTFADANIGDIADRFEVAASWSTGLGFALGAAGAVVVAVTGLAGSWAMQPRRSKRPPSP